MTGNLPRIENDGGSFGNGYAPVRGLPAMMMIMMMMMRVQGQVSGSVANPLKLKAF